MFDTVMTCMECQAQNQLFTLEWPPKGIVCNECGQIFKVRLVTKTGRVFFEMVPHKL